MIKAIIFDMDGVLINSEKLKAESWKNILRGYGVKNGDKWYKKRIGTSRLDLCKEAIKEFSLPIRAEELAETKKNVYKEILKEKTEPIYDVIEFLKIIPKDRLKTGLVSSTNMEIIRQQLTMIGVYDNFDIFVAGEEDVKRNKPFPDVYQLAAKRLNLDPEQCIAIEDSTTGIESAKSAGMKCIAYKNSDSGNQDLSKADYVVKKFSEFSLDKIINDF